MVSTSGSKSEVMSSSLMESKMQQVNSVGFRLGSTVGWQIQSPEFNNQVITKQLNDLLRKTIAKRGSFLINAYYYFHRGVAFCPIVYYRYHQRSRLQRWLVGHLNRREGALAPAQTRYFMLYKNKWNNYRALRHRKKVLKRLFPKIPESNRPNGWVKLPRQTYLRRGWIDAEFKLRAVLRKRCSYTLARHLRSASIGFRPRAEFHSYNLFDFMETKNPTKALNYYVMQRFGKLLYQHDVISAVYVASQRNLTNRLAHAIVLGLERHAGKRRQQRQFLSIVRLVFKRIFMWDTTKSYPLWRRSIFGKLDAKMRRVHVKIRVGFIRYQEIDFLTNYSYITSRTKYGTSSVRIWIRNFLN